MSSFYTCVPKIMIIWCRLPEIWSTADIIFYHFRPCFALLPHYWPRKLKIGKNLKASWRYYPFTHTYQKWRSYDVWFLRYKAPRTFGHFLPFDPPNNLKNQNFVKMKKAPGDIIIYTCVPQMTTVWCIVPEIWWAMDGRKNWHMEVGATSKKKPLSSTTLIEKTEANPNGEIVKQKAIKNLKMSFGKSWGHILEISIFYNEELKILRSLLWNCNKDPVWKKIVRLIKIFVNKKINSFSFTIFPPGLSSFDIPHLLVKS